MKKALSIIISLTIILFIGNISYASDGMKENYENTKAVQTIISKINPKYIVEYSSLSSDQKDARLKAISTSYTTPGEVLNESDSAFILLCRWEEINKPQLMNGSSSKWYDVYKTQYGVRVNLFGTMKQDICYIAGSSRFEGTATAKILSGSVKRVDLAIHHTAYGLIGTNAPFVGVLYNGSTTMTKSGNNKTTRMDKTKEYGSILPVYTTMYTSGTINTAYGDEFTITSSTWTLWQ